MSLTVSTKRLAMGRNLPIVALIGLYLFHMSWIVFRWNEAALEGWSGDFLYNLVISCIAWCAWWVALKHKANQRLSWLFMATGISLVSLGDWTWSYFTYVLELEPFPSLADVFYLSSPILFVLAFIYLPQTRLNGMQKLRLGLDVAITVIAAAVMLWPWQLASIIADYGEMSLELVISLAYPATDLILLALLLSIIMRQADPTLSRAMLLLTLGFSAIIIADLGFSILSAQEAYSSGHSIDAFWTTGYGLLALAGYFSVKAKQQHGWQWLHSQSFQTLSQYIPYLAIFISFGFMFAFHTDIGLKSWGTSLGVGFATVLVVIRQILALKENQRLTQDLLALSQDLENRVIERSRELEDSQRRLRSSEKLASLGRLMGGIAHEINTPLAAARNYLLHAKTLSREYHDSIGIASVTPEDHKEIAKELAGTLNDSDKALERLGEFVRRMRSHTHSSGTSIDFDPLKVTEDSLAMLEHRARKAGIKLLLEPASEPLRIHGDPSRFSQVLSNLLVNGMDACESLTDRIGQVTISFSKQQDKLDISIADNGSGIPEEILANIFEPMFTTKEIGKGTGLGLSIVHDIISGHFHGEIKVSSVPEQGTVFCLSLPLAKSLSRH